MKPSKLFSVLYLVPIYDVVGDVDIFVESVALVTSFPSINIFKDDPLLVTAT